MNRRAVFLDRDGVLNRATIRDGVPRPPDTVQELEVLPGVREAVERLRGIGLLLIAVSNQPDVARGRASRTAVDAINRRLQEDLRLDDLLTCFHDDADRCECRKPQPGLIRQAADRHRIGLVGSFLVGDRDSDVGAGRAAGCLTFLVDASYNQQPRWAPDFRVVDLADAAGRIIELMQGDER